MKRLFLALMLAMAVSAGAQTPTVTTPQSVTNATVFNGVSTAQASGCLSNLGQTTHFVLYSSGGAGGNPTGVQIRIEASFNSDAATCSTGTWSPISDDGIEPGQNQTGIVMAIGAFPFLRVNLVTCSGCDAGNTISASYTGTSAISGNPFGRYGAGQQIRKVQWVAQTGTIATAPQIITPYGSSAGFALIVGTSTFSSGTISEQCLDPGGSLFNSTILPTGTTASFIVPVPAIPCNLIRLRCSSCQAGGGANTTSAYYFFYPPGEATPAPIQPAITKNSEATAVNATVTTTLTAIFVRAHLFTLNARCSAGTAGVTVQDGATTIWSSGATEVGTTSFTKAFNPGLASSPGNNLVISLTTCGAANTGTLDVQGSVGP